MPQYPRQKGPQKPLWGSVEVGGCVGDSRRGFSLKYELSKPSLAVALERRPPCQQNRGCH